MKQLKIHTKRGVLLDGALFSSLQKSDTVMIAITGIHGNFYSNPFYYNIGNTLSAAGIDFVYAQTNDAFGAIRTQNTVTTVPTDMAEVKKTARGFCMKFSNQCAKRLAKISSSQ